MSEVCVMSPFNMKCMTCGQQILKGELFKAVKEFVPEETFLRIPIYKFLISCPRCKANISIKLRPQRSGFVIEEGATRNLKTLSLNEKQELEEFCKVFQISPTDEIILFEIIDESVMNLIQECSPSEEALRVRMERLFHSDSDAEERREDQQDSEDVEEEVLEEMQFENLEENYFITGTF